MNRFDRRWIVGLLLVVAGVIFLLQNLGLFTLNDALWGVLFGLGGLVFLGVVISNREHWWALIPGMVLLGIGGLIIFDTYFPAFSGQIGGPFFLAMIGLAFWLIYLLHHELWWAVIPGGVMLTIAAVAGLGSVFSGTETGGIFFLGIGLTFLVLAVIPTPSGRLRWPLIPGIVLGIFGVLLESSSASIMRFFWPVLLIAAGLFIFLRRVPTNR